MTLRAVLEMMFMCSCTHFEAAEVVKTYFSVCVCVCVNENADLHHLFTQTRRASVSKQLKKNLNKMNLMPKKKKKKRKTENRKM